MGYISQDRVELTKRFIKVWQLLEAKGEIQKNSSSKKNQSYIAEKLLGSKQYGHIIGKFLALERYINYEEARIFCIEFGIDKAYMLEGIGEPFSKKQTTKSSVFTQNKEIASNSTPISKASNGNILFFPNVQAFAGTAIGSDVAEEMTTFSIPGISGNDLVSFPVKGNSMEPVLNDQDVLICKQIKDILDIKEKEIYVIKNNGVVWVKYLQPIYKRGKINALKLISANYLEYDPFVEEVNSYTQVFKVVNKISKM